MSDKVSFRFRIAAKQDGDDQMSSAIADEVYTIATQAANPVRPGESIKSQMNRAWLNLGRPPLWRLKSAWYRDGSGCWSAQAVRDFQTRYLAWRDDEARRSASTAELERTRQRTLDRDLLVRSRADVLAQLARLEACLASLTDDEDDGGEPA